MKRVLLVFSRSDSGVDGPRSVHKQQKPSAFQQLKETFFQRVIQKAQFAVPPYALLLLSSYDIPGVAFELCDMRYQALPLDEKWDLVGISVHTGIAKTAFDIAAQFRRKNMKVVLGGPHVSLFPETCIGKADALVVGEADEIWREVLSDLVSGKLKPKYEAKTFPDLRLTPQVKKEVIQISDYFTTNLIQTSRGCPYQCDFCNVSLMNGRKIRHRPVEQVVAEVASFLEKDQRVFFFVDDTINADPDYAFSLFNALIPYQIKWVGQATTLIGRQKKLLEIFAKSGCRGLLVGIEGLSDASLTLHNKTHNSPTQLLSDIQAIRDQGICVYGSFIYGLDGDTLRTADTLLNFVEKSNIDIPGINLLRPIPGTALFERFAEEGRLLFPKDDIYAFRYSWAQELQCKPKNIPVRNFIQSYSDLTQQVYTFSNALKRAKNAPTIKSVILMFNLAYIYLYGLSRKDLNFQLQTSLNV
ncbi:Radical SAM domain protein [Chloroherpeton thalassium ATCC 35110]|uniref:Radical SAM domain protein n=1 Tax=Chloroherpeton thalassium (strain ATCC 35110 / GB-78) TaxID=517418 RepID=B3QVG7_CHLT3|nr:radical SAM protein [Chloroherpeton thalassium]ACF14567.1 Radical SAM domain protein [Chloroherpeton thalassium ATCC 35110]